MGRRQKDILGGPTVVAGAVLEETYRRDIIRAAHVSHKHARPRTPEYRVGCGGEGGGMGSKASEIAARRPVVARAGKSCARAPDPLLQMRDTRLKCVTTQLNRAITGRAMAGLLLNRE